MGTRFTAGGQAPEPVQSVTSAPVSNADDQGLRMRRYLVAMGTRTVCFVLAIVASGWVRWTLVAAAVALPYIAVVLANAVGPRFGHSVAPVRPVVRARTPLTGVVDDPVTAAPHPDDEQHPRAG